MDYEKKYKEALGWMRSVYQTMIGADKEDAEHYFPELKESKDEKIRKYLIESFKSLSNACTKNNCYRDDITYKDVVAWLENITYTIDHEKRKGFHLGYKAGLEKQGEQKPIIEMKSPEESLGIDSDTYNKIVDECIYGEQKPADKVEPKFKVGQTIKKEGFNLGFPIVKIENGFYYNDMGDNFPFTDQDNWELVEQKPADWSEEDEDIIQALDACIDATIKSGMNYISFDSKSILIEKVKNWLKSLRTQSTWKPSEEQIKALERECMAHSNYDLCRLCEQLKKLREE